MATTVLISTFPPFSTLAFSAPSDTTLDGLYDSLFDRYPFLPSSDDLFLSPLSGVLSDGSATLATLQASNSEGEASGLVSLRLAPRMLGGKGGFGSQLRAAGGRMSSQKTSNNDSCRDLSGRRLSTIKEAKKLAEYLESEPDRKKAAAEAQKAKLEALERKLGIDKNGGPSEPSTGKKRRLDDTEFIEQSRDIVDNVKSAVVIGLLKKKKKAKTSPTPEKTALVKDSESAASSSKAAATPTSDVTEKAPDEPPTSTTATFAAVGA